MKQLLFTLFALFTCLNTYAGDGSGKITHLLVHKSDNKAGVLIFGVENNDNKATCSIADEGKSWAVSLANEEGKAMYSLLLTAATANKNVYIKGTNKCGAWNDREEPFYITLDF